MLPNNFPISLVRSPDTTPPTPRSGLWLPSIGMCQHTGDQTLAIDLFPALEEIVRNHLAGTRYHIGVDPQDGLLRAGDRLSNLPGWMPWSATGS